MSKKIKILIIFLLFLFITNIIYPVLGGTKKTAEQYAKDLGVTANDLKKSRDKKKWQRIAEKAYRNEVKGLTDADLIRLMFYDASKEDKEDIPEYTVSPYVATVEKNAQKEIKNRKQNKKSGVNTSTEEKDEQLAELYDKARAKQKEIDKSKDKEKTKKLKEEFIDIVNEMEKIDYKDMLYNDTNYNALLIQRNQYITDLDINVGNVIYKQPNIITKGSNVDGTLDDMISDADSFVSKGNQASAIKLDGLKSLSGRMYDILLEIGVGAAVLIGIILGIRFLLSGVEEKAEVKKMLWVYTVGCIVTFGAFGIWKLVVTILQKI